MIIIRRSQERGHADHGWLNSYHTFSFGNYHDPAHMGFRSLRVINEDRVKGGEGFGTHGHRDMEIISYVLAGGLEHKDSLGNGSVIRPGDLQRLTAGTGIRHSEFNPSPTEPVHFLQIWILPERAGLPPGYEQQSVADHEARGKLRLVASRDGQDGALTVHQDVRLYIGRLDAGQEVTHALSAGRHAWLQVTRGGVGINGQSLQQGDGAAISEETSLTVSATDAAAEVLLFDLA